MKRANTINLIMHDAVPFGQQWTYHATDILAAQTDPDYFIQQWRQLKTGDEIKLLQMHSDANNVTVVAFTRAIVVKSTSAGVVLFPEDTHNIAYEAPPAPVAEPFERELYSDGNWKALFTPGNKTWRVVDDKGISLARGLDEPTARAIASGSSPLPQAEEVAAA